jgi:hypothetical protein
VTVPVTRLPTPAGIGQDGPVPVIPPKLRPGSSVRVIALFYRSWIAGSVAAQSQLRRHGAMLNGWLRQRANGCPAHSGLIPQVKQYMRDWFLGKVIRVADPRVLLGEQPPVPAQGARGHIIGEKLRSGSPHVKATLSRQGRYQQAAGNLQVKEVRIAGAAD